MMPSSARVSLAAVLSLIAVLVSACRDGDVVAKVGRTELRLAELEEFASRRAPGSGGKEAALEALITRARLAEHARALELEERPDIRARLAAARREVLAQAVLEERLREVADERALRERYEAARDTLARRQVRVRHIMVRLASNASEADRRRARDQANLLYARVIGGEPFEEVAREASQDEASAPRGGELGRVREGEVHAGFFEAAAALEKDEVSKPFETPVGMHVVQALAPMETARPSFEEARARLAADARREVEAGLFQELEQAIPAERFPEALHPRDASTPETVSKRGDDK
ncbi:MAG: peptidylprolyl isomerase [Myxococcaceae bacterium]|nr:peptidylprolyl isomerase [Myxococcaceae bacterium]